MTSPQAQAPGRGPVLYLNGVTVSFDGFRALNGFSLYLEAGEMRAVIGPNGAGKTTMMDVVTGRIRPDSGEVFYRGETELTRFDEARIANMGIGRKFQQPTVFEQQTVFENLELALRSDRGILAALRYRRGPEQVARIESVLETIGLAALRDTQGGSLAHGQKQWLEIGMLLIQEPELLLVDEPAAGMTDAETEQTARLLREISTSRTVVVVEHDMDFVQALQCKVTVMHEGSVLAEGTHEAVQNDPRVIDVYLGR